MPSTADHCNSSADSSIGSAIDASGARRGALRATLGLGIVLVAAMGALVYGGRFSPSAAGTAVLVFGVGSWLVVRALASAHVSPNPPSQPHSRYGAANTVTQFRLALSALLAGITSECLLNPVNTGWWLIALVSFAAALDAVDGKLARAQRLASPLGARFDMEVDAFFLLLLSVLCWLLDKAGAWVMLAGLMRYLFVAAASVWRWLAAPLPASRRRQAVCVIQIVCLIAALAPVVTGPAASGLAGAGLVLLTLSFGKDVLWLYRAQP